MIRSTHWIMTEHKDISFEHCGVPAYWEGDDVYCSKCQEKLEEGCPCSLHTCPNIDEYVKQGVHCEECFRECSKEPTN